MAFQIALDGPSGVGKSTVAKIVGKKLNFVHIDTGAMYRAVTLKALNLNVDLNDPKSYDFLDNTKLSYDKKGEIMLDGKNVEEDIRSVAVTENVSLVSSFKEVRQRLVKIQRALAENYNVIMDGRDIGTTVLPHAYLKVFMVAPVEIRADRRYKERKAGGNSEKSLKETIKELLIRDQKDSTRKESPLKMADDALLLDTSNLNAQQVGDEIIKLFKKKGERMKEKQEAVVEKNVQPEEQTSDEKTASQLRVNQIVKAKVKKLFEVSKPEDLVNDKILLEMEDGTEGFLHRKNMILSDKDAVAPFIDIFIEGDEFELAIARVFDDGKVLFSQTLIEKIKGLEQFEGLLKEHALITATVKRVVKHGVVLEYKGYECILPEKLHRKETNYESLVGEPMEVAVIRIDHKRLMLVVSEFLALSHKRQEELSEHLKEIKVGDKVKVKVKSFTSFGAFVTLENGLSALLHISDISHDRVTKAENALKLDEELEVEITEINGTKVNVSRKKLLPNHFSDFVENNKVGSVVKGKINEINNSGIVLEFENNIFGFLPRSEFAWGKNIFLEDQCKLGDKLEAKIIDIGMREKRIVLSKKQMIENPWKTIVLTKGEKIKATVLKKVNKGYKVEYKGLLGFLPEKSLIKEGLLISDNTHLDLFVLAYEPEEFKFIVTMKEDRKEREKRTRRPKEEVFKDTESVSAVSSFGDFLDEFKGGK